MSLSPVTFALIAAAFVNAAVAVVAIAHAVRLARPERAELRGCAVTRTPHHGVALFCSTDHGLLALTASPYLAGTLGSQLARVAEEGN